MYSRKRSEYGTKTKAPQNHRGKRANFLRMIGFTAFAMTIMFLTLNCTGFSEPKNRRGQNDRYDEKPAAGRLVPSMTPEETVKTLYGDSTFFNLRNEIPYPVIDHLSPCITPELKAHLEHHKEKVAAWMARNENTGLKLPVSEGPIFLSNYEGADDYQVGKARIDGTHAEVPVSFSITDAMGTFKWVDVAILRQIKKVWRLENIKFQPDSSDNYTLQDRIALIE